VFAAWRTITRREVVGALLLAVAYGGYHYFAAFEPIGFNILDILFVLIVDGLKVSGVLLGFVAADRMSGRDPDARVAHAIGVTVGAFVGTAAAITVATYVLVPLFFHRQGHWGGLTNRALETAMLGIATVWVILDRRRAASWRKRRQSAELERMAAEKRTVQSELQAIQARVEPQFLFDTLEQVRALYKHDAPRAERMLDDLIAYLRAAMPRMRDTTSNVGQELDLVASYLAIIHVRDDRLRCSVQAEPATRDIPFPPMMLLPLVNDAMRHARSGSGLRSIAVDAAVAGERLTVTVADSGGGFAHADADGVASVRERLDSLYDASAALTVRRDAQGSSTAATIDVPFERAVP
jgi:hypothetical protein